MLHFNLFVAWSCYFDTAQIVMSAVTYGSDWIRSSFLVNLQDNEVHILMPKFIKVLVEVI
jgi:hypothetical protein